MCVYLTKRNSTYYFRRVIPPELRSVLGVREFTFSLETKDKDEAKRLTASVPVSCPIAYMSRKWRGARAGKIVRRVMVKLLIEA